MPAHFARFSAGAQSPGVILLREATPISTAIEELVLIWNASEAEEWVDRLVWIPHQRLARSTDGAGVTFESSACRTFRARKTGVKGLRMKFAISPSVSRLPVTSSL